MKHDKNLPVWYRVTPIFLNDEEGEKQIKATIRGVHTFLLELGVRQGKVESVQKINGEWVVVEGRAKNIINTVINVN